MKKTYLLIFLFFVIILVTLFVFYDRYSFAYEEEKSHDIISKNIDIFEEYLNEQKQYALSLSIMLSKNVLIQKALLERNQALALKEIHKILNDIADSTGIDNIDVQVHMKDTKAFVRNWDNSDYLGVKLGSFRKGLLYVKNTKESFASLELGKRLNIKAISPIFDSKEQFIGSLEVIMDFSNIKKRLEKSNIQMLALLDKRYINIAVDLKDHLRLQKYYVVEKKNSRFLYQTLKNNPKILKQKKFFYKVQDKVITFIPMKSLGIQKVGSIVLAMDAQNRRDYNYPIERIVFENSLYTYDKFKHRKVIIK
jgi:hypothetical protein